jgi:hypothetical protein
MISLVRWLVFRFAALGWATKWLGSLGVLLPLAFLLKFIGLPLLGILGVVAAPALALLFLFGLPVVLVLGGGAILMSLVFAALAVGMFALKVFVFVVLPIYLVIKIVRWVFRRGRDCGPGSWWRRNGGDSGSGVGASPKPGPFAGAGAESAPENGFNAG